MKRTRAEVAVFINRQLHDRDHKCKREKGGAYGYGIQELRELMDFIFDGAPESPYEEIYMLSNARLWQMKIKEAEERVEELRVRSIVVREMLGLPKE